MARRWQQEGEHRCIQTCQQRQATARTTLLLPSTGSAARKLRSARKGGASRCCTTLSVASAATHTACKAAVFCPVARVTAPASLVQGGCLAAQHGRQADLLPLPPGTSP